MKLRRKGGHLIHMPLDTLFTMSELFGSLLQKYDAVTGEYIDDLRPIYGRLYRP